MTNLLALLVSLAMILTGATAPVAEPVSRTLTLSNLTVRVNEEEVTLNPYASVAVMTDGAKAVYDMFIGGKDGEKYLPFQLAADENGLLLLSDNSNVTVKLTREELESLMEQADISMSEEDQAVFGQIGEFFTAYADMLKLVGDPEARQEIQAKAEAKYDELIERGEGTPDRVEIDGETYDVTVYEYDLTGAQMGALTDAVMATDERLANYAAAYFKLFAAMPEDSGLKGIDSYAAIFEKLDIDMTMHMVESVAENGPTVTDAILHINAGDEMPPLEFVIHGVKSDDDQTATMTCEIDADGMLVSMYAEGTIDGRDMTLNMTFTANPSADTDEIVDDAEAEEAETVEEVEELESDDADIEGDAEDAMYFTVGFDQSYDEAQGATNRSLNYTLDIADVDDIDAHAEFAIEGASSDDGACAYNVSGSLDIAEQSFGFAFDANVSDAPVAQRVSDEKAVSVSEVDPTVLIAGVSADALKLYTDESVQKLVAMGKNAVEQAMNAPDDADDEDDDDDEPEMLDGSDSYVDPDQDPAEIAFANPQFNWLPEGYAVEDVNVEAEYQDVSCNITNQATGDTIFVDINQSYNDGNITHYVINGDGSYEAIDGVILDQEVSSDYSFYSMDDGDVHISVFPSNPDLPAEDVIHILTALTF